jgi:hypothetical protein
MFQQKATQTERLPAFHSRNMSCGLYGILISNNEINLHFANWGLSVLVLVFGRICIPDVRWFMAQGLYTTSGLLGYCSCRSSGSHYALFWLFTATNLGYITNVAHKFICPNLSHSTV